jgi:hypothetical protein
MAFERAGGQHGAMQTTPHPEVAELVKLAPAKRQARFYRLAIWPIAHTIANSSMPDQTRINLHLIRKR